MDGTKGTETKDVAFEGYLLKYTFEHLSKGIDQQIEDIEKKKASQKSRGRSAKPDGLNINDESLKERINLLKKRATEISSALEGIRLLKHILTYKESIESAIAKATIRLMRLKEENIWLHNELENFTDKTKQEKQQTDTLQRQIAHFAFIYHQRRNRNHHYFPPVLPHHRSEAATFEAKSICALDSKITVGTQLKNLRSSGDNVYYKLGDVLDICPFADIDTNYCEYSTEEIHQETKELSISSSCSESACEMNCSNSAKLSLTELRELMLGDNRQESKKQIEVGALSRKVKTPVVPEKILKIRKEMMLDCQISEQEKETLKHCMKTLEPTERGKLSSTGQSDLTLTECVEKFIRSNHRSNKLNMFIDLVCQFNHKELHSPGIGLCWVAIELLKAMEKESRASRKRKSKESSARVKTTKSSSMQTTSESLIPDVDHSSVLNDLCKLLSIVAYLYKSRNELEKAGQCLKEILRIRRITHTWKQPSVATALSSLSSIQVTLKDCNCAITNARKALQLRRDLLHAGEPERDSGIEQVAVAQEATNLALMLMNKQQNEQKKLRYHRFPFRDLAEIPSLLSESIKIYGWLNQYAKFNLSPGTNTFEYKISERLSSVLGDNISLWTSSPKWPLVDLTQQGLIVSRNALAIYYICIKKWAKVIKHLTVNNSQLEAILPSKLEEQTPDGSRSLLFLAKLTCLKSLLYVYRVTNQPVKATEMFLQLSRLDPFSRIKDEIVEQDLIRLCEECSAQFK